MNSYLSLSKGLFALLLITMIGFLACEDETITIERTEDGAVVRTDGPTDPATVAPVATPLPGDPVTFPPMSDGAALMALYDAAGGANWSNNDGWVYTVDIGQWHGVTTDAAGRVTALDLSGNGLSGELPEDIGILTGLAELDLSDNGLSGSLPDEIGDLTALEELYLNGNQFSGALPTSLGGLTALTDLHLHGNQFGAEFPAALDGLSNLESVTIWNNKFSWADSYAPGLLADMVGLVALYESAGGDNWSERSGWLSDPSVAAWSGVSIGGDGRVTGLDLSENQLSGELPPQIGSLASLTALDLSNNQLTEDIPAELGNLTALEELYLNNNQLDGKLPAELGNLTALTMLHLHTNQLGGNLPAGLGGLSDLEELHLHTNRLSGPIPSELGNLGELTVLWLHDNQFSGELPGELTNITGLERLSLWGTQLTWAETYAPGIVADMVGLVALYDSTSGQNWGNSSNWLTVAPVSEWHGVATFGGELVTELNMQGNGLNGELPPQLGSLLRLRKLDFGNNQLGGEIPAQIGNLVSLEELNLADNQLKGNLPTSIGGLSSLIRLHVNNNQLNGPIPSQLSMLSNLEELNLASNLLSGPVPRELGDLSALKLLYLDTNDLSGELPSELGNLSELEQVSMWGNELTWADQYANGILADTVALVAFYDVAEKNAKGCYGFCNWLTYTPLSEWEGIAVAGERVTEINLKPYTGHVEVQLTEEISLLSNLTKLDLRPEQGRNTLVGDIPATLGSLAGLRQLYLNNNSLSGEVPAELGNLTSLEQLHLNNNALSGEIPPELGSLTKLKELYLANNQLTGELPSELGNLSELEQVSFWGNKLTWADQYKSGLISDMVALVDFYESFKPEWISHRPIGQWHGVTTGAGGRVTHINFHAGDAGQDVKLSPELGRLTNLRELVISGGGWGQLIGEIPPELVLSQS